MFRFRFVAMAILMTALSSSSSTQGRPDTAAVTSAQVDAMKRVEAMDGVWRGPTRAYSMRSYAMGFSGDYVFTPLPGRFRRSKGNL